MLSAQRLKELFSTLRFRLVLWITLVVFVMVVVTNIAVREVEQRTLRSGYDQFLKDSLEEVNVLVADIASDQRQQMDAPLKKKVKDNAYRTWFLQLYDENKKVLWGSDNAPILDPPTFVSDVNGPYDEKKQSTHRVYEKKLRKTNGEVYFIRCGFLQLALQEDIDLLNRNILLASISILLAAPLGGYVIALRATQPITQIIETTAHLQPSNLNERLPIRGTGDEIDQLSQTINGMLDRLASYIEQNRDFVANAAHELRSPLAAIRTSVEVGLNQSRTPEEYAAILTDVMEEITRLAGLVNRLLILAEGDAGRLAGGDQFTQLDKVVRQSIDMFDAVAESKGVRLTVGDLPPITVQGDEAHLRQVVRNLIDNAIKYNRNPGEVVVNLRVDPAARQVLLIVKDTGIGIDPEVLPRIFERFYRADKARSREKEHAGYGLGLSICQTVIQALHGEITVETIAGSGTTFTVRLPLIDGLSTEC
ncbi:MAG: HAMP domain-containing protein [Planctomycetes bacterium]|nr:HAMP domain-containing protein [Planctomycetota bacterium]